MSKRQILETLDQIQSNPQAFPVAELLRLLADVVEQIQSGDFDLRDLIEIIRKIIDLFEVLSQNAPRRDWSWLIKIIEQLLAELFKELIGNQKVINPPNKDDSGDPPALSQGMHDPSQE